MKRKSLDELFSNLHITLNNKKPRIELEEKVYTQTEVDNLLRSQQQFLFNKFKKYVEITRTNVDVQIPNWTC